MGDNGKEHGNYYIVVRGGGGGGGGVLSNDWHVLGHSSSQKLTSKHLKGVLSMSTPAIHCGGRCCLKGWNGPRHAPPG